MDYKEKYLKYKKKYIEYKNKYLENVQTEHKPGDSFTKNLIWRRSEKHFLPGKVDIEIIKSAIINSPSSYGIQPYKVLVITDQDTKMKLKKACMNQAQIEECYALFIFCALNNLEKRIDEYVDQTGFEFKKKSMLFYINNSIPNKLEWAKRQAYIALGFAMAAAAEKKIAGCPMEGFEPDDVAKILKLDDDLKPCVLFTVGRHNPNYKLEKRFRFNDIIEDVKL